MYYRLDDKRDLTNFFIDELGIKFDNPKLEYVVNAILTDTPEEIVECSEYTYRDSIDYGELADAICQSIADEVYHSMSSRVQGLLEDNLD